MNKHTPYSPPRCLIQLSLPSQHKLSKWKKKKKLLPQVILKHIFSQPEISLSAGWMEFFWVCVHNESRDKHVPLNTTAADYKSIYIRAVQKCTNRPLHAICIWWKMPGFQMGLANYRITICSGNLCLQYLFTLRKFPSKLRYDGNVTFLFFQ